MFKNLLIYRIAQGFDAGIGDVEQALAKSPFIECGATQEKSSGWVPPRGEAHGALIESVGGQWILRFFTETKTVPASVIKRGVDAFADEMEEHVGRRPGKKERREIAHEVKQNCLPHAFAKQAATWVWIDPAARLLAIDATSQSRADEIVSALVEALPGLSVSLLHTNSSPQACMAHWLKEQEPPAGFTVDRECELKAADESKAVVKYGRHPLDIEEIQNHINHGKLPTKLALTWDDRVSFVLTEGLQLKKLAFLDSVFDGQAPDGGGFDADVVIATSELSKLILDLIEALGGEADGGPAGAASEA